MHLVQIVYSLSFGDAVSNDVIALRDIFKEFDAGSCIYAMNIDRRYQDKTFVKPMSMLPVLTREDIVFYHMAISCMEIRNFIIKAECRKFIIYHNVTPAVFFHGNNMGLEYSCKLAMDDMQAMREHVEGCIAVSAFNKLDLIKLGYDVPIAVLPILIPFEDYAQQSTEALLTKYQYDGWTNILFVGRIVPNKKQQDLIAAFAYYKKYINPNSRLFIVGNPVGQELYMEYLQFYIKELGVADVIFSGHVSFSDILAYYRMAHVFLCMSEHEGFCVPLLEAMYFRVPVLAYSSTAIPFTLAYAGVLFRDKQPAKVALLIERLVKDKKWREEILDKQTDRLKRFSYDIVANEARTIIKHIIRHEDISNISGTEDVFLPIADGELDMPQDAFGATVENFADACTLEDFADEEIKFYMEIYEVARNEMRDAGKDMPVTQMAFQREMKAYSEGNCNHLIKMEWEDLNNYDFMQMIYMRIMRRVPPAEQRKLFYRQKLNQDKGFKSRVLADIQRRRQ